MIRALAAVLALAAGWSFGDLNLDRALWNARERTAAGIEGLEAGETERALEAFETAARLEPADPLLRFNAGSAHLSAASEGATGHLEVAAEAAPEWLRPAASYNLGNARLAAGDPAGAITAYENALRADPGHEDAKFNLELALQQQQQQQQQQEGESASDESETSDQSEQQPSSGDENQNESSEQPDEADQPDQAGQADEQPGEGEQDQQLPQFEDQPDMTAEQAAAILEAVENLEREQRRKQAEEEMKKRPRKGKDW